MAGMGSDVIKSSGAAVVDLYAAAGERTSDAWNKTITTGAKLVDRLIDQSTAGFELSEKVVASFTPTENAQNKTMQYAVLGAAALGVVVLMKAK